MPREPLPPSVHTRRRAIGERIRTARRDASLTQEQLAERCGGIDRRTIHRIEYGTSDPTLSLLLLISDALGVRPGQLVDD